MKRILIIMLALCTALVFTACNRQGSKGTSINVYFANSDKSNLVSENRTIDEEASGERLLKLAVEELLKGPNQQDHITVIPEGTKLLGLEKTGTLVTVNLSGEFLNVKGVDEALSKYMIVKTLCEIPGVEKVLILAEGNMLISSSTNKEVGALGLDDIIYPGVENTNTLQIALYFANQNADNLVKELREVQVKPTTPKEMVILTELMKGPQNPNLTKTIPDETKLISVETRDGICVVNFSKEFIDKHPGGTSGELMTIYSIVNSLTELPDVNSVQFLIEGQKVEVFKHLVFNEPFERYEDIIEKAKVKF